MRYMLCLAVWALSAAVAAVVAVGSAAAQSEPGEDRPRPAAKREARTKAAPPAPQRNDVEQLNRGTVTLVTSRSSPTHIAIAEDLATLVDAGNDLRLLPVIGRGPAQNVLDALFLRGMDMALTQANVLTFLKKSGRLGRDVEVRLAYVAKLFNEEVHLVAAAGIADIRQLEGKVVNFGEEGSGTDITAQLVFSTLGVKVVPANVSERVALARIRAGEMAATMHLAGKPSAILERIRSSGEFKLLSIPYEEALEEDYLPAKLTHNDYPQLIPQGSSVDTIAVPAVLAAFNWRSGTDRHRRVARFVDAFLEKFPALRSDAHHEKWREVNLMAELPGWQRLPAAKAWLDARKPAPPAAAGAPAVDRAAFNRAVAAQRGAGGAPAANQDELFRQFMQWMQANQRGGATSGTNPPRTAPAAAPSQPAAPPSSAQPPSGSRLW